VLLFVFSRLFPVAFRVPRSEFRVQVNPSKKSNQI